MRREKGSCYPSPCPNPRVQDAVYDGAPYVLGRQYRHLEWRVNEASGFMLSQQQSPSFNVLSRKNTHAIESWGRWRRSLLYLVALWQLFDGSNEPPQRLPFFLPKSFEAEKKN
jgi:hypothetical protein